MRLIERVSRLHSFNPHSQPAVLTTRLKLCSFLTVANVRLEAVWRQRKSSEIVM